MGICLGMQVLFEDSTEKGMSEGLGLIKGHVRKMEQEGLRVPHMGWNQLVPNQDCSLFDGRLENNYVYKLISLLLLLIIIKLKNTNIIIEQIKLH